MVAELAVLVIHGMGDHSKSYANGMIEEVNQRIDRSGVDHKKVVWETIHWSDINAERQRKYLIDAKIDNKLRMSWLRGLMLSSFGDVSAYQKVDDDQASTYEKIHNRISESITKLHQKTSLSKTTPLIVMGHSLGGHIISNYIWDMQHSNDSGLSPFEKMQTHAGMITFGCNIPFFTFAYDKVIPIEFPAKQLSKSIREKAQWLNFYDGDDVLGYPLKPISPEYNDVVTKDIGINVGGFFSSRTILSHSAYWEDNDFTIPVSEYLRRFL